MTKKRYLGYVEHIVGSKAVVKLSNSGKLPKLNQKVVNDQKQVIGKIIDIIGPTKHPWAVVTILKDKKNMSLKVKENQRVYIETRYIKGKKKP